MNIEKQKQEIIRHLDKDFVKVAEEFFEEAKKKNRQNDEKTYRKVDKEEAAKIKANTGLDVEGYEHKIIVDDLAHIYNRHGNPETEAKQGQIAVTADDIKLIPEITKNYDSVELSKKNVIHGTRKGLLYRKKIGNEYYYLESVGGKKRDLRAMSMYIRKSRAK